MKSEGDLNDCGHHTQARGTSVKWFKNSFDNWK